MSKIGLKKVLNTILVKEFPLIEEIMVEINREEILEPYEDKYYIVNIGIAPGQLRSNELDRIRTKTHMLSKLVLGPKDRLISVRFYNPHAMKF